MRPPSHAIDSDPVYILPDDPAWDHERLERESGDDEVHPLAGYFGGETRYDLTAQAPYKGGQVSAGEYLGDGATRFHLRRMSVRQMAKVQDMFHRMFRDDDDPGLFEVWSLCVQYGLAGIEGMEYRERGGICSESTLQRIYDELGGLAAIERLGTACWRVSQPLSEAEGKR
jgi:hypothetical protein